MTAVGVGGGWGLYAAMATASIDEEAAMVLRYARNVASSQGMVWNVGDRPVDGATDFLFTLIVAAGIKVGFNAEIAARAISWLAHVLTVGIVFESTRRVRPAAIWPAFVSAIFVALGPAGLYLALGFGTPFFGFWTALTWFLAMRLAEEPRSPLHTVLFGIGAFLMALSRPEGALLAILYVAALVSLGTARRWAAGIVKYTTAMAIVMGGAYLWWRWSYFGHVLPIAFYRKGGSFRVSSLFDSVRHTSDFLLPFLPLWAVGLVSPASRRRAVAAFVPTVGFVFLWSFLSTAQNVGGRFQYPIIFPWACSWPVVLDELPVRLSPTQRMTAKHVLLGVTLSCCIWSFWNHFFSLDKLIKMPRYEGTRSAAMVLRSYRDCGYSIATSEAGILPFYSDWRAIDTWGLHDFAIASRGIDLPMLEVARPEVIMFNRNGKGFNIPESDLDQAWLDMVRVLRDFAEQHEYRLAAAFCGTPRWRSIDYYYVRRDFADAEEIRQKLGDLDYRFTGEPWPRCARDGDRVPPVYEN